MEEYYSFAVEHKNQDSQTREKSIDTGTWTIELIFEHEVIQDSALCYKNLVYIYLYSGILR